MPLCSAALANGPSKQPDMVLRHSGGCGDKGMCSQCSTGLGQLSVGLVFLDSLGRWGYGDRIHRCGTAPVRL